MVIASAPVRRAVVSGEKIASLDLGRWDGETAQPVELVLKGVQKTADSLELRISLSSGPGKGFVAGSLYTYGEGKGEGEHGSERFSPIRLALDITAAARRLAGARRVDVRVQFLDNQGRESKEPLFVDEVEWHRREEP